MFALYPHQMRAIGLLRPGTILTGGVGSGKSAASLAYFFRKCGGVINTDGSLADDPLTNPMDLYIITTARKRDEGDWIVEAGQFGFNQDPSLSRGGVRITIDSWNNISKYENIGLNIAKKGPNKAKYEANIGGENELYLDAGDGPGDPNRRCFFIFDEQRLVGKGAWVKTFLVLAKRNLWILLSATPGDTWMDYLPVFLANGFYTNRTDFYNQHVIWHPYTKYPRVQRYVGTKKLERLKRQVLIPMPFLRHTTRHILDKPVGYPQEPYNRVVKARWHIYEDRPIRDISEMIAVARKVVNTDPERAEVVRELREKHRKLIVFYNFNYELDILRELYKDSESVRTAEWNGHKHEPVPESEDWIYLVQYMSGAEAWNCVETDAMVFYSLNYSFRMMDQAMGRIDRMNTPYKDLYYYRLRSLSSIDASIMRAIREKRTFNERNWDGLPPEMGAGAGVSEIPD